MAEATEHKPELSDKTVFIALLVLTALTVAIGAQEFENRTLSFVLAMGIAGAKASLVGLYFMHLRFAVKPVYVLVGFPLLLTAIVILAVMPDVALNPENVTMPTPVEHHVTAE